MMGRERILAAVAGHDIHGRRHPRGVWCSSTRSSVRTANNSFGLARPADVPAGATAAHHDPDGATAWGLSAQ